MKNFVIWTHIKNILHTCIIAEYTQLRAVSPVIASGLTESCNGRSSRNACACRVTIAPDPRIGWSETAERVYELGIAGKCCMSSTFSCPDCMSSGVWAGKGFRKSWRRKRYDGILLFVVFIERCWNSHCLPRWWITHLAISIQTCVHLS